MTVQDPPSGIEILTLPPSDWHAYKDIRLEALQKEPQAYASTYEDNCHHPDTFWQARLEEAANQQNQWLFFAKESNKVVGMVGAYKQEETIHVIAVYVQESQRGKKIGYRLMKQLLAAIHAHCPNETIQVQVNADQTTALNLYRKLGFMEAATEVQRLGDGKEYTVITLEMKAMLPTNAHYQPVPVTESNFGTLLQLLQTGRQEYGNFKFIHIGAIHWGVSNRDNLQLFINSATREPVGFAWYDDPLSADYAVLIDDTELHMAIHNWLTEKVRLNPDNAQTTDPFSICCFEDDAFKNQFLDQQGFTKDESDFFLHQVLNLSTLSEVESPEGFAIRPVRGLSELQQRADLHRNVFSTPDKPSKMTDENYARIMNLPGYNTTLFIDMVAVTASGEFVCFAGVWIDTLNKVAYVEPVGTKEAYRRKGLARATIYTALMQAKTLGCSTAIVLSYSDDTRQVYKHLGFEPKMKEFFYKKNLYSL